MNNIPSQGKRDPHMNIPFHNSLIFSRLTQKYPPRTITSTHFFRFYPAFFPPPFQRHLPRCSSKVALTPQHTLLPIILTLQTCRSLEKSMNMFPTISRIYHFKKDWELRTIRQLADLFEVAIGAPKFLDTQEALSAYPPVQTMFATSTHRQCRECEDWDSLGRALRPLCEPR
ncbi:hypothetical protein BDR22DRAFT_854649 [Usnea florida]